MLVMKSTIGWLAVKMSFQIKANSSRDPLNWIKAMHCVMNSSSVIAPVSRAFLKDEILEKIPLAGTSLSAATFSRAGSKSK